MYIPWQLLTGFLLTLITGISLSDFHALRYLVPAVLWGGLCFVFAWFSGKYIDSETAESLRREFPRLPDVVEAVAASYGIDPRSVRFRTTTRLNVRSYGLVRSRWTITLSTSLPDDGGYSLAGVLAHEFAHLRRRHDLLALCMEFVLPLAAGLACANVSSTRSEAANLALWFLALFAVILHFWASRELELSADGEAVRLGWRSALLWSLNWAAEKSKTDPADDNSWGHPTFQERARRIREGREERSADSELARKAPPDGASGNLFVLKQLGEYSRVQRILGMSSLVAFLVLAVSTIVVARAAFTLINSTSFQAQTQLEAYEKKVSAMTEQLKADQRQLTTLTQSESAALQDSAQALDIDGGHSGELQRLRETSNGMTNALAREEDVLGVRGDGGLKTPGDRRDVLGALLGMVTELDTQLNQMKGTLLGGAAGVTKAAPANGTSAGPGQTGVLTELANGAVPLAAAVTSAKGALLPDAGDDVLGTFATQVTALGQAVKEARSSLHPGERDQDVLNGLQTRATLLRDALAHELPMLVRQREGDGGYDLGAGTLADVTAALTKLNEALRTLDLVQQLTTFRQNLSAEPCDCEAKQLVDHPELVETCFAHCGAARRVVVLNELLTLKAKEVARASVSRSKPAAAGSGEKRAPAENDSGTPAAGRPTR